MQINTPEFSAHFEFFLKQHKQIQEGQSFQEWFTDNKIWHCKFKGKNERTPLFLI